jgi:hypothetical protein
MPPSARKPAAKKPDYDGEKAAEAQPAKDGEICVRCWPNSWPGQDSAASCVHGVWKR